MKKRFLDSLPSDWIKYLVVILLSVLLWVWVFGLYHAPKETEKLEVFYAGAVKDYAVEETTADALGLKLVSISSAYPWTGNAFDEKYSLVALTASDVVIVPKEVADETDCERAFEPMREGIEGESYSRNGVRYGVYLSSERKQALSAYFEFEYDEYIVFAVAASMNSGQVTNHSFELIEWLVG